MSKYIYTLVVALLLFTPTSSCKKEDVSPEEDDIKVTVFKNQSGDSNADALQAQLRNNTKGYQLNFYGNFAADNTPVQVNTVTVRKDGNDTTVFFLLDPISHKLEMAFTEVNGVRQPWLIKHDYIVGSENEILFSLYEYNWQSNTGTLKYQSKFENNNGVKGELPTYSAFKTNDAFDMGAVAAGIVVAEAVCYGSGVGIMSTAAGAALVGAAGTIVSVAAAATIVVTAIAIVTSSGAHAGELQPTDHPLPTDIQIQNPVQPNTINTNVLPTSPCNGVSIAFSANMDIQGSIVVINAIGGSAPYSYAIDNLNFQSSEFFINSYPTGWHNVMVKDANGCISSLVKNFDPNTEPVNVGFQMPTYTMAYSNPKGIPGDHFVKIIFPIEHANNLTPTYVRNNWKGFKYHDLSGGTGTFGSVKSFDFSQDPFCHINESNFPLDGAGDHFHMNVNTVNQTLEVFVCVGAGGAGTLTPSATWGIGLKGTNPTSGCTFPSGSDLNSFSNTMMNSCDKRSNVLTGATDSFWL